MLSGTDTILELLGGFEQVDTEKKCEGVMLNILESCISCWRV